MNGYTLQKTWYKWCSHNIDKVRPIHSHVFGYLCFLWNLTGNKAQFGLPTDKTMNDLGIGSYHTYKRCLDDLIDFGFISVVKISTNQHNSRIISFSAIAKTAEPSAEPISKATAKADAEPSAKADAEPSANIVKQLQTDTTVQTSQTFTNEEFINNLNLNVADGNFDFKNSIFNEFVRYWTEPDETGKMRFQKLPFFDFHKQIELWLKNEQKFNKKSQNHGKRKNMREELRERLARESE